MKRLLIIFAILLMAGSAWGTDYYVNVTAVGAGDCTESAECTLATANGLVAAGDTVHMLAGSYTTAINPTTNDAGSYITYQKKAGEAEWSVIIGGVNYGVDLKNGQDYIKVKDIYFNNVTLWVRFPVVADADGANYFYADTCKFYDADNYEGILIEGNSDYGVIDSCIFPDAPVVSGGYWDQDCIDAWAIGGDLNADCDRRTAPADFITNYGGEHWLFKDNTFGKSVHSSIGFNSQAARGTAQYNVVRNNSFDNSLHRPLAITGHSADTPYVLVSDNLIKNGGVEKRKAPQIESRLQVNGPGIQLMCSEWSIIRYNDVVNNDFGILWGINSNDVYGDNNRVYHNTFYNNHWGALQSGNDNSPTYAAVDYDGTIFKNNIFDYASGVTRDPLVWISVGDLTAHDYINYADGSVADPLNLFAYNVFPSTQDIYFKNQSITSKTLAQVEDSYGSEWSNNVTGSTTYVDSASDDYTPTDGSVAVNAADYLTTVLTVCLGVDNPHGDCTAANQLRVADAKYFYSGAGVPWSIPGETGDTIYDVDGNSAVIQSIDYATNVLTVDSTTGFVADDEITTVDVYGGAPDIGSTESGFVPADIVTVGNITFWWRAEAADFSGTNGTLDYSAGDDTATLVSAAAINTDAVLGGSPQANGLDVPTGGDSADFSVTADLEISSDEGRVYMKFSYNTWINGACIFYLWQDADNFFSIEMYSDDGLKFSWKDGGTVRTSLDVANASIASSGTTYNIEFAWKAADNDRWVYVNGVEKGSDLTSTINAFTESTMEIGEGYGGGQSDYYLDDIIISSDSTEDLYALRNEAQYPLAAPVVSDVYLCDCADPWAEITDPTTYTQNQQACFAITSDNTFSYLVEDGGSGYSQCTLGLTGSLTADYISGGGSTKMVFAYTVPLNINNADVDLSGTDALADGDIILKNAFGVEFDLTVVADLGGIVTFSGGYSNSSTNGGGSNTSANGGGGVTAP